MTFTLIIKWKSLWQSLYPRSNHCPKIWLIFWLIFNLINWSTCRFKPSLRPSCSHFLVLLWRHLLSFFAQTFHMKKKRKRNCWLCRIWCWEKAALLLFWIEVGLSQLLHCQQIHRQTTMVVRNVRLAQQYQQQWLTSSLSHYLSLSTQSCLTNKMQIINQRS